MAELDLFACCRHSELVRIDQLGTTIDLEPGRLLCEEGSRGGEFFVLLGGAVDVRTRAGTAAVLYPGAWFGEAALIDGPFRRATVTTRTQTALIVFGKREFKSMLQVAPSVRDRLRRSTDRVIKGWAPTRNTWYQPLSPDPAKAFDDPNPAEQR
jgi:CRP-like cAMP-binding protein